MEHTLYFVSVILFFAAVSGWINARWLHWPSSIAMVLPGIVISLAVLWIERHSGSDTIAWLRHIMAEFQFGNTLLIGMLSFLLFAGALEVDYLQLKKQKWPVLGLATFGVVISTLIIGVLSYSLLAWLDMPVALPWCLVFGALISPTDPVAVMSIIQKMGLSPHVQVQITGESLLNDGVVITLFAVLAYIAEAGTQSLSAYDILVYFLREVLGGLLPGIASGYLAFLVLSRIDDYFAEIVITLALVTGLYSLALLIHTSGPLAVVAAGLLIGHRDVQAMSERARTNLRLFWKVLEHILNSMLFVMIGFELLALGLHTSLLLALLLMIPLVLLARFLSVSAVFLILPREHFPRGAIRTLTWGGLRGGISIALALSLPDFDGRMILIILCYGIVISSLVVQGLTLGWLARRWMQPPQG